MAEPHDMGWHLRRGDITFEVMPLSEGWFWLTVEDALYRMTADEAKAFAYLVLDTVNGDKGECK